MTHSTHPAADAAVADHHGAGIEHAHPTWSTYWKVATILTLITAVEVWVYYVPAIVQSRWFVPVLLIMSAVKFAIVVLFYMHLKYDHRLFRVLFTGPLIIAMTTIVALMFLFGKLAARVGAVG
ncbi:MAG: cytochrome C oxidase subunit IV family protein [Gemmatimonadaceae bacterium]|nr:cytochrome C oxidase subunit IV family protein [Gemmatimonadaceae bacterium]NUQ92322.1 cytochrome C oxidase subunit IV family protein [Gemmatimonadaceae bacterium]